MGFYNSGVDDTSNTDYQAGDLTVGTSQVLACANGSSNMSGRQNIIIYNRSNTVTIYVGPSGITTSSKSIPIPPQASITFNVGDRINMYLLAPSAGNTVTVQEVG